MKWIGQHIYDLVARYRSDVYLDDISTGTIASGGNLGLDSNNKIVKAAVSSGGISHDGSTADGVLTYKDADEATVEQYLTFANSSNISTLSLLSDQDTGDKFTIATTTHGATTLTTVDDDATAAHFEIAVDGNITLDSAAAINLEVADTEFVDLKNGSNSFARFYPESGNSTSFSIYEQGGDSLNDYFNINVAAHGGTTLATVDAAGTSAHFEIAADGNITLDPAGTIALEANTTVTGDLTVNGDTVTFESANADDPIVTIKNTSNGTNDMASLKMVKDRADNDVSSGTNVAEIYFVGEDSAQNEQEYGRILCEIDVGTNGQESGALKLGVASHDGETAGRYGLQMVGGSVEDEIDVTIADGTASLTTVAGDLTVSGSDLTFDSVALTGIQTSGESFADNDTSIMTSAAIDDRINAADTTVHATVQTGKHYRIVNTSFRADIGTTKYYLPLKSQDEQTVLTREENQEVAVCDGRLVSLTWRAEAFNTHTGDATVTFGVETNTVGSSYSGGYSVQETEAVTVNHADDQHLWHVVFDSAKHWDSTDMFTISMQSDVDITGSNERIFITLVIEDDWSTYLAGATREIDTTP